jgi:hypothetical protein
MPVGSGGKAGLLNGSFHRRRQGGIDEELFDVISGFEALASERGKPAGEERRRGESV